MSQAVASFHDVLFPVRLMAGSTSGLERKTDIVRMASGHEQRNTPWRQARRHYTIAAGPRPLNEIYDLMAFFEARRGPLIGFRWRDWLDYKSCGLNISPSAADQICDQLGEDRTRFILLKRYGQQTDIGARRITKPVVSSVKVAVGGLELAANEFAVDQDSGIIKLSNAAGTEMIVTAGYEFDVPVRFDTDRMDVEMIASGAARLASIPVIELPTPIFDAAGS